MSKERCFTVETGDPRVRAKVRGAPVMTVESRQALDAVVKAAAQRLLDQDATESLAAQGETT